MTQPNQNTPPNQGGQHDQKNRQHEQGRGPAETQKQGSKGYGGGSTEEKHPGGKALDINDPGEPGKGEQRDQASRRQDR